MLAALCWAPFLCFCYVGETVRASFQESGWLNHMYPCLVDRLVGWIDSEVSQDSSVSQIRFVGKLG